MIDRFEEMIRRDPARRGLVGSEDKFAPLCPGHLALAAQSIADSATHVGLVTGFYVPRGEIRAAETDGPPGAAFLAHILQKLGVETTIITDPLCLSAVQAAALAMQVEGDVVVAPHSSREWSVGFLESELGNNCTHLLAIERAGPSHTLDSFRLQNRLSPFADADFESRIPLGSRNRCHNMRGELIDEHTADLYQLFDLLGVSHPKTRTIGIGDGANEIGMGSIPWEDLSARLSGDGLASAGSAAERAHHLPCRVATTWNIIAGTSNWGAFALAAAVAHLRKRAELVRPWDQHRHLEALEYLVKFGPAVDGVTGKQTPTVDGLPFLTYIQPWLGIRRLLGFG